MFTLLIRNYSRHFAQPALATATKATRFQPAHKALAGLEAVAAQAVLPRLHLRAALHPALHGTLPQAPPPALNPTPLTHTHTPPHSNTHPALGPGRILRLAAPMSASNLAGYAISMVAIAFVGRLGEDALSVGERAVASLWGQGRTCFQCARRSPPGMVPTMRVYIPSQPVLGPPQDSD